MSEADIQDRALLIGIDYNDGQADLSLDELEQLCKTAGIETIGKLLQRRERMDISTFIGFGKVKEAAVFCQNNNINIVVIDEELKGSQVRELEEILDIRVIDRTMLILDIFATRAKSTEGKLQVELAQYKYRLPRLTGFGNTLSKLGGGIGTRGPGETKLETDKRHIRRRITHIEQELREVSKRREMLRNRRKKENVPTIALVGYTNAGKSSLMNALCENSEVYVRDQLFATLDPTIRKIKTEDNNDILLIDTVGFIRKLPHTLIEAFKSTLEESTEATLLLHVIDYNDPDMESQMKVVEELLQSLGTEKKDIFKIFNKCDLKSDNSTQNSIYLKTKLQNKNTYLVSAKTGDGLNNLKKAIIDQVINSKRCSLVLPFQEGNILNQLHQHCQIIEENYLEDGIHITVLLNTENWYKYQKYIKD